MASRSAGPIANRITVLAFIISGATLQSNSSKFSCVMRKNVLNNTASKRSSWTSEWYSPCRDLLCRMGCTQKTTDTKSLPPMPPMQCIDNSYSQRKIGIHVCMKAPESTLSLCIVCPKRTNLILSGKNMIGC